MHCGGDIARHPLGKLRHRRQRREHDAAAALQSSGREDTIASERSNGPAGGENGKAMSDDLERGPTQSSSYEQDLGIVEKQASEQQLLLALPYAEHNSLGFGKVHGGVLLSLAHVAASRLARRATSGRASAALPVATSISYLSAVAQTELRAEARLLRKGRDLVFIETLLRAGDQLAASVQSVLSWPEAETAEEEIGSGGAAQETDERGERIEVPAFSAVPFVRRRDFVLTRLDAGHVDVIAPASTNNLNEDGLIHTGVVFGLMDVAGSTSPWTMIRGGVGRGATIFAEARVCLPISAGPVRASATVHQHRDNVWWSGVEVTDRRGRRCASGTVVYRVSAR